MSYEFKSVCPVSVFPSVREFIFELAHLFSGTQLQLSGTSTLCKNKNVSKRDFWADWTGKYKRINGALTFWKNLLSRKTAQVIGQNSLFQSGCRIFVLYVLSEGIIQYLWILIEEVTKWCYLRPILVHFGQVYQAMPRFQALLNRGKMVGLKKVQSWEWKCYLLDLIHKMSNQGRLCDSLLYYGAVIHLHFFTCSGKI